MAISQSRRSILFPGLFILILLAGIPTLGRAHPLDPTLTVAQLHIHDREIECTLRGPASELLAPTRLNESDLKGADTRKETLLLLTRWLPDRFLLEQDSTPLSPQALSAEYKYVGAGPEYILVVRYPIAAPPPRLRVTSRFVHTIVSVNDNQFELRGDHDTAREFDPRPSLASVCKNIADFTCMGMEHLFTGPDHILFICTLIFALMDFKSVVKMLTGFTIGHSITLILTTFSVFTVPARLADMGIALTIVYVGAENIFRKEMPKHRFWVVFVFGLVHGMGFSSSLREAGLPDHGLVLCLLGFNLGIEFAQIVIVASIFPILVRLRKYRQILDAENGPRQFKTLMNTGSAVTACMGCYWLISALFQR